MSKYQVMLTTGFILYINPKFWRHTCTTLYVAHNSYVLTDEKGFQIRCSSEYSSTHYSYLQGNSMSPKNPTDIFDMVPFSAMSPLAPLPASNGSAPPPPARPTEMSKSFLSEKLNIDSFNHKVWLRRQSFYCHIL